MKYRCPICNSFVKKGATYCFNCDSIIDGPKEPPCQHPSFDIVISKEGKGEVIDGKLYYLRCHHCKQRMPFFFVEEDEPDDDSHT